MNEKNIKYKWYILNVISGQENKVCEDINHISKDNKYINQAFIPTKKVFKYIKGKKVEVEQKIFPAYVFVNLFLDKDNEVYSLIKSVPKVLSFLGSKNVPVEVSEEEIERYKNKILKDNLPEEIVYEVGETVKIIDGPFESFVGVVESKNTDKNILKVSISIFGRVTSVDIETNRVEKMNDRS